LNSSLLQAAASAYIAGDPGRAQAPARAALAEAPAAGAVLNLLGCLALATGADGAAAALLQRAEASGVDAATLANLSRALHRVLRPEGALRAARRALALLPGLTDAHLALGEALQRRLAARESLAAFHRAAAIEPDLLPARELAAETLLLLGEIEAGAAAFFRYQADHRVWAESLGLAPGTRALPASGDVTLVSDARLGDALQFVRYAVPLAARGLRVAVEVQPELVRLLSRAKGVAAAVPFGTPRRGVAIPMHMLMHLLAGEWPRIGALVPYLSPAPEDVSRWRSRLSARTGLRLGLIWAGRADGRDDALRSPGLDAFAPVFDLPGITVFGLQLGDGRADLARSPLAQRLVDLGSDLTDLAETAAAVAALDLMLTSDTAMVHLAGALGRPVWMIPPRAPSWRWLLGREDSPWYPTLRLFRPSAMADWSDAMRRVVAALKEKST
jgi:tetratricopeptide (TPR) repeat protein